MQLHDDKATECTVDRGQPPPTTMLADDLRALRDQLRAHGVKPMTIEEFDRELAERHS